MLLHIVANDKTFKMQHVVPASEWVAEEFAKKALHDEPQVDQQVSRVGARLLLGSMPKNT